jgi:hypothetical protein
MKCDFCYNKFDLTFIFFKEYSIICPKKNCDNFKTHKHKVCKSCFSNGIATINYDTLNKKINEKQRKREKYIEKDYRKK